MSEQEDGSNKAKYATYRIRGAERVVNADGSTHVEVGVEVTASDPDFKKTADLAFERMTGLKRIPENSSRSRFFGFTNWNAEWEPQGPGLKNRRAEPPPTGPSAN